MGLMTGWTYSKLTQMEEVPTPAAFMFGPRKATPEGGLFAALVVS